MGLFVIPPHHAVRIANRIVLAVLQRPHLHHGQRLSHRNIPSSNDTIQLLRGAGTSTIVQPRAPKSDAAHTSAGAARWPAARAVAASAVRIAPHAAPVSPK